MSERKITNESRDFKGVWIPKKYWLDENLSPMEVMFMAEIDSLDSGQGCYASNNHFADFFGVSAGRVSQVINSLAKKGYIELSYNKQGKQILSRLIRVVNKLNDPIKKTKTPIKNSKGGYLENAKGSNTTRVIQESNTNRDNVVENSAQAREENSADKSVSGEKSIYDQDPFDFANNDGRLGFVNSGTHIQEFANMVEHLDNTLVCWALYQTAGISHPSWNYFKAVIDRAKENGIENADEAEHQRKVHNKRYRSPRKGKAMRKETLPDWAKSDDEHGPSTPDRIADKASEEQVEESRKLLEQLHARNNASKGSDPSE